MNERARFATAPSGLFPYITGVFVALLLISNIGAVKLIELGPIITDGGAILFPLVYVVGDILSEVYGFKAARKVILTAFAMSILAAFTFHLVQIAPAASDWENQEAFEAVLGFVPRIVLASVTAFVIGQLLNSYVLVKIKERTREKNLWLRLMGSTVVGEFADTLIFCTIAFYGVITGADFLNYLLVGFLYKSAVEFLCLPITYRIVAFVKSKEPSYA